MFQYILESLKKFLIRNYFYSNAKKCKQNKSKGTNFDLTTDSVTKKHETISIKFKIRIAPLIAKIQLKQRSLNQIRHCSTGYIQI